jgi:hypothetical protein
MHIDRLTVIAVFVFWGPTRFEGAMSFLMDVRLDLTTGTFRLINSKSEINRTTVIARATTGIGIEW